MNFKVEASELRQSSIRLLPKGQAIAVDKAIHIGLEGGQILTLSPTGAMKVGDCDAYSTTRYQVLPAGTKITITVD